MNLGTRFMSKDYSTVHNSHNCIFICRPVYYALNVQDRYFRINFTKKQNSTYLGYTTALD